MDKKITIVTMIVTIILTLALLAGGIFLSRHLTAQAENNNIQEELPNEPDIQEPIYYGTWVIDNSELTGIIKIDSNGFGAADAVSDNGNYILFQEYTYTGFELTEIVNGDEIILIEGVLSYNTKTNILIYSGMEFTRIEEEKILITEATHFHTWSEWKVLKAPTCTEKGEERRECKCSDDVSSVQVREIPATGHNFRTLIEDGNECIGVRRYLKCEICGEEETMLSLGIGHTFDHPSIGGSDVERIPATCTSPALNKATCSRCGEVQLTIVEGSSALGHTFSEWEVVTPATCTEEGLEQRVCSRCGEIETREIAIVEHNYTDTVLQAATCSAEGIKERTCSDCGYVCQETIPIDSTKHTYEYETVVQATCTTAGQKKKICSVCGFEELISISPSHTYTNDYLNNRIVCSVCGHDSREITNNTRTLLTEGHLANGDITSSNMSDYYNISGCENGIRGLAEQAGLPSSSFNVFVPEVLYNRPVKEINNNAFSGVSGVKYIYVSDGITIAANAFANCRDLLYLSLPSTARGITFDFTGCPDTLQILYRD